MKNELIKFLQSKTTTFSVREVNQMITIISQLEEKEEGAKDAPKPKKK